MDFAAEEQLAVLVPPEVRLIPIRDIETPEMEEAKSTRSRGEYCWTCTPAVFGAVFDRAPEAQRVTYLDADLFFFRDPRILLDEFARSGKDILVTEHAFAPEYDVSRKHGGFCVQFIACKNSLAAAMVIGWWRDRCLEWRFNGVEPGRFGDQKYLDDWPERFGHEVHILGQPEETLAPWNVDMFLAGVSGHLK